MNNDIRLDVIIKQLKRIADALEKIAEDNEDAQVQTNNKKFVQ